MREVGPRLPDVLTSRCLKRPLGEWLVGSISQRSVERNPVIRGANGSEGRKVANGVTQPSFFLRQTEVKQSGRATCPSPERWCQTYFTDDNDEAEWIEQWEWAQRWTQADEIGRASHGSRRDRALSGRKRAFPRHRRWRERRLLKLLTTRGLPCPTTQLNALRSSTVGLMTAYRGPADRRARCLGYGCFTARVG